VRKPRVVADGDHLIHREAERAFEQRRQRRQERRAGEIVEGHLRYVARGDAVVHPAEAERRQDLPAQEGADGLAGHALDDLAEDEAAGDRVVGEAPARAPGEGGVAEHPEHGVVVLERLEPHHVARQVGNTGAMGQHVLNGDAVLSVRRELGNVLAHRVVEVHLAALHEKVDEHRRHRLGGREDIERRRRRRGDLVGALSIGRSVAARVTDGAVDQHLAVPADAELEGRMNAAAVQARGARQIASMPSSATSTARGSTSPPR
jgi:hypothetical protein